MTNARRGFLSLVVVLALGGVAGAKPPPAPVRGKPNIVFFLIDNTSWGSFGAYGGPIPTPRFDALAREGIRFTNYNVEVQCTPTRAAILTGRHPVRSGTYAVPMPGGGKAGLTPWEYTIAELLSDAGYATALYGKWHVGNTPGRFPNDQGFDEWWGIPNSWDESGYTAWPQFKESGVPVPMILEGKKGQPTKPAMPLDLRVRPIVDEKYLIPKTVEFIKRNAAAKTPFFVYLGYSELHEPIIPNPSFARSTKVGDRVAECIAEMDVRLGQVVDAIKEAGIEDNTIIIFSSDNADGGATPQDGTNYPGPWRGNFFYTPFEGSMRVPAIIRWPGKIPAGVVTDEMLAAVDWLPTLAGMAGASNRVPKDRPIDGVDASAFMLGRSKTTGRDNYMFFGADGELMSVKWKNFKTVIRYTVNYPPDSPAIQSAYFKPSLPMMYDLSKDPHEDFNLFYTDLTNGWAMAPVAKVIGAYEASIKKYPNIKMGADFNGYRKGPAATASATPVRRSDAVVSSASNPR